MKQLYGVCILTGIGFTMSLFIDGLAYEVSDIFNYADNLAILIASFCSGIWGFIYLKFLLLDLKGIDEAYFLLLRLYFL